MEKKEMKEEKENIDTADVANDTNEQGTEQQRTPSEPIVIAKYRIPEKKRNHHNRIFFWLFCISIIVFGTTSLISFPLVKTIKEKKVFKSLYEKQYVFITDSDSTQKNAIKIYTKAADKGDPIAQEMLGMYYYYGEGVEKNIKTAIGWLTKSAEQGNIRSQYMLADLYYFGKEIPKNHTFAAKWFKEAAELGDASAQYYLANMYMNGDGVAIDKVAGLTWLRKSAEQGNAYAQNDLGDIYLGGTDFHIKNYKDAFSLYLSSAEQGYLPAIYSLGYMYFYGLGVDADYSKAIKFYIEAANKNYMKAQAELGILNYNTHLYIDAFKYFSLAAEQGDSTSQLYLGRMYENGYGIIQDYSKALYWYTKASEQGNKIAKESIKKLNIE